MVDHSMKKKAVLVTGGAGYIGSHVCKALRLSGYLPVTFDNLITGWAAAVRYGPVEFGDIADKARLTAVFDRWKPSAVVHLAGLSNVGDAFADPGLYWRHNLVASLSLIDAATEAGCRQFIFSSTCAVYGDFSSTTVDEDTPQSPLNAYGASKRAVEDILRDYDRRFGLRSVVFRYFNAAGADPDGTLAEVHIPESHIIPILLDVAAGHRDFFTINGTDYETPDGTCVRDYIHVSDLADAHVRGLDWLERNHESRMFCLGSGSGFSVREVVDCVAEVTGRQIAVRFGKRRLGDAPRLVSGSRRARSELDWLPSRSDLRTMVTDAWRVHLSRFELMNVDPPQYTSS